MWENIPSAFGIHFGVSGQIGAALEGGITPFEILFLFNWRSGEFSIVYSAEAFLFTGTPSILGGNIYGGTTGIWGLSQNRFVEGAAVYGGVTFSLDAVIKGGLMGNKGKFINPGNEIPPDWFIDPGSGQPVEYEQYSLIFGGNLGSNAFDAGIFGGFSASYRWFNYQIPWWPKITSK